MVKQTLNVIVAFLALISLCPAPTLAQDDNPWKERDTCVFGMPYTGHAVKPSEAGLIIDILKAVYEPEDIDLKHEAIPYKRAVEGVLDGSIDCSLDVRNSQKGVLRGNRAIAIYTLSVAYLRKNGFKGVDSLVGNRVAYRHGYDLKAFLPVKIRPQLVYDLSSGFHMLERGHVAYVLGDVRLLKDAMFDSKLPAGEFEITEMKSYEVRPIFAPNDRGRRYRDIYDRRIREMIQSGQLQEIMKANGIRNKNIQRLLAVH